ncbi:MAG: hypothetical protein GY869_06640, partial [Planctomycetes bacterium]|nr:hypothetical protein [Planctomycetota bacterium]
KGFSLINIIGLAIGMASCIIIYLYVHQELSFDRFHSKEDSIYRVLTIDKALGVSNNLVGITIPPLAPALKSELPEIIEVARFNYNGRIPIRVEDRIVYSQNAARVDPEFFDIFDFKTVSGDAKTAITEPNTAVISQDMAQDILLVMARRGQRYVAGAINFIGSDTLYGRHWGCVEDHP